MTLRDPPPADHPDPDELEGPEFVDALMELIGLSFVTGIRAVSTLGVSELNWKFRSEAYHCARRWTGGLGPKRIGWSPTQKTVALLNAIDADVDRFVETDDPIEEAEILYECLLEAKTGWEESDRD